MWRFAGVVCYSVSEVGEQVVVTDFMNVAGWQWDPKDRPTFKEIHYLLENMFEKSSISEGKQLWLAFFLSLSLLLLLLLFSFFLFSSSFLFILTHDHLPVFLF